jgi:hypothetical protein
MFGEWKDDFYLLFLYANNNRDVKREAYAIALKRMAMEIGNQADVCSRAFTGEPSYLINHLAYKLGEILNKKESLSFSNANEFSLIVDKLVEDRQDGYRFACEKNGMDFIKKMLKEDEDNLMGVAEELLRLDI